MHKITRMEGSGKVVFCIQQWTWSLVNESSHLCYYPVRMVKVNTTCRITVFDHSLETGKVRYFQDQKDSMFIGRHMDTGNRWFWFKICICHFLTVWLQASPWISLMFIQFLHLIRSQQTFSIKKQIVIF